MFLDVATPHKEGCNNNFTGLCKPLEMEGGGLVVMLQLTGMEVQKAEMQAGAGTQQNRELN